jgi:hypothetical protein
MNVPFTMLSTIVVSLLLPGAVHAQWLNYPAPGVPRLPDGMANLSAPAPLAADGQPEAGGWRLEAGISHPLAPRL